MVLVQVVMGSHPPLFVAHSSISESYNALEYVAMIESEKCLPMQLVLPVPLNPGGHGPQKIVSFSLVQVVRGSHPPFDMSHLAGIKGLILKKLQGEN